MGLAPGWTTSKLQEVCDFYAGVGFPSHMQGRKHGKYPFYKVGDISKNVQQGFTYLEFCENYIQDENILELGARPIPENTVVFAKIGESLKLNRRAITKTQCLVDNNAIGIRAKDNITDKLWIFYFLKTIKLENYSRATTVPSVRKADIEEIYIPLPPLAEQHRIVSKIEELFSDLDKGVESLKVARQQLKIYRQAVLKWAFEGKLNSYNEKSIKTISSLVTSGSRGWAKYYSDEGARFIRIGNLTRDNVLLDLSEVQYVDLPEKVEGLRSRLQEGDLLISITADLGSVGIIPSKLGEAYINQHIAMVRLHDPKYSKFVAWFLKSEIGRTRLLAYQRGATKKGLGLDDIREVVVPFPDIGEAIYLVQEIESRLSVCDKLEESIEQSLAQADALRQSILKQAFEGKLVPQDPNDEPAEKLLERIRAERDAAPTPKKTIKRRTKK